MLLKNEGSKLWISLLQVMTTTSKGLFGNMNQRKIFTFCYSKVYILHNIKYSKSK